MIKWCTCIFYVVLDTIRIVDPEQRKTYFFYFYWFQVDAICPKLWDCVRHIFQNIISTIKPESARSLSMVVAWGMRTVLTTSPNATKHVHVSFIFFFSVVYRQFVMILGILHIDEISVENWWAFRTSSCIGLRSMCSFFLPPWIVVLK